MGIGREGKRGNVAREKEKKRGDWGKLIMTNHLFALRVLYVDRPGTASCQTPFSTCTYLQEGDAFLHRLLLLTGLKLNTQPGMI